MCPSWSVLISNLKYSYEARANVMLLALLCGLLALCALLMLCGLLAGERVKMHVAVPRGTVYLARPSKSY